MVTYRVYDAIMPRQLSYNAAGAHIPQEYLAVTAAGCKSAPERAAQRSPEIQQRFQSVRFKTSPQRHSIMVAKTSFLAVLLHNAFILLHTFWSMKQFTKFRQTCRWRVGLRYNNRCHGNHYHLLRVYVSHMIKRHAVY